MKIAEVQSLCREMGIVPSKKFGQNFLVDERVIEKILLASEASNIPSIVEIGPGLGALTKGLLLKGKKVRLIEYDKKVAAFWLAKGVDVLSQDALKVDWGQICGEPTMVVSNLPYQISSSITIQLSFLPTIRQMVFMYQKEVAQRITAKHGGKEYGLLTVIAQTFWDVQKVTDVSERAFYPPPKVESRVLSFQRKNEGDSYCKESYLRFVKVAFSQRRKVLINKIKSNYKTKKTAEDIFHYLGLSSKIRAEELSVDQFQSLYNEIENGH